MEKNNPKEFTTWILFITSIIGTVIAFKMDNVITQLIYTTILGLNYFIFKQKKWARILISCIFIFSIPYQIIPISHSLSHFQSLGIIALANITALAYTLKLLSREK
jgi:hypothetical protein